MRSPAYILISESLTEQIESGQLKPGDRLASERTMSEQLGVSRMTIRQAIDLLQREGIVERYRGSGTFVSEPKIEQHVDQLVGFSENMVRKGFKPGAVVLALEVVPAPKKLAKLLDVKIGQSLYYIHRLRTANNEPIALEYSYFPVQFCEGLERFDLTVESIYRLLADKYGIHLKSSEQIFEPVIANAYESEMLGAEVGDPLMLVKRVAFDIDGTPIEYAKDIYRGDRSRFVARSELTG